MAHTQQHSRHREERRGAHTAMAEGLECRGAGRCSEDLPSPDHRIGPHPLVIGKVWPRALHCWTRDQFEGFLRAHHLPAHTWADQQEGRRQAVIQALLKGTPIPQDVLAEDSTLEADADMHRRASLSCIRMNAWEAAERVAFENEIGYTHSFDTYRASLRELLLAMLKPVGSERVVLGRRHMAVSFKQRKLSLKFVDGRPPNLGVFGAFGGRPARAHIIQGESDLGPVLHAIAWDRIESALTDLLVDGAVCYEDIWWWTGTGWQPPRATIQVICSLKKGS